MLHVLAFVNIVNSAAVNLGVCNANSGLKNSPLGLQALEGCSARLHVLDQHGPSTQRTIAQLLV